MKLAYISGSRGRYELQFRPFYDLPQKALAGAYAAASEFEMLCGAEFTTFLAARLAAKLVNEYAAKVQPAEVQS